MQVSFTAEKIWSAGELQIAAQLQAQPTPIRAETALWDMQTGRIRIVGGSGSGVR